jgi:hypothetical protein
MIILYYVDIGGEGWAFDASLDERSRLELDHFHPSECIWMVPGTYGQED